MMVEPIQFEEPVFPYQEVRIHEVNPKDEIIVVHSNRLFAQIYQGRVRGINTHGTIPGQVVIYFNPRGKNYTFVSGKNDYFKIYMVKRAT